MPGILDTSSFHAQYLSDWEIYRAGLAADDADPIALLVPYTLKSPTATGLQIWVTVERVEGGGTLDLNLFRHNTGTLANISARTLVGSAVAQAHLAETRFTNLTAGSFVIEVKGISAGGVWNLHVAVTSGLTAVSSGVSLDSVQGKSADYGGNTPNWTPSGALGMAVDSVTERIWWYYNGVWN